MQDLYFWSPITARIDACLTEGYSPWDCQKLTDFDQKHIYKMECEFVAKTIKLLGEYL